MAFAVGYDRSLERFLLWFGPRITALATAGYTCTLTLVLCTKAPTVNGSILVKPLTRSVPAKEVPVQPISFITEGRTPATPECRTDFNRCPHSNLPPKRRGVVIPLRRNFGFGFSWFLFVGSKSIVHFQAAVRRLRIRLSHSSFPGRTFIRNPST